MKFNFNTSFFENIIVDATPIEDVYFDYSIPNVGEFKFKIFDSEPLIRGVGYFRPLIRGFFVLLLALYNVKMALSFIRQDAGVVTGKVVDISMKGENL